MVMNTSLKRRHWGWPKGRHTVLAALVLVLAGPTVPLMAQDNAAEIRLRKLEAEIRALQRQVFPGGDGKFFPAQVQPGQPATTPAGVPATTPVTDILARMEALEAQIARLTAQTEVNTNKITQIEAKLAALTPAPAPTPAPSPAPAVVPTPVPSASPAPRPTTAAALRPASGTAARPAASGPSAQRLAAVRAVEKPASDDPGDDEYSYGFRLWEAKFYPEAQQQLKLFLNKYPRHTRVSYARNLLGRAYLDEGNPREAASWFLQNYNANKAGDRAPDSVLLLAESMRRLNDTKRACVALSQFTSDYPREAAGRLKVQYDLTRGGVTCN
jgi:TolA-binding protein